LADQLDSLVSQERQPDEVILSDDCSCDGTVRMLAAFAARAPFEVTLLTGLANVGVVANFERAIQACSGDIIALADQDDVWLPHKLSTLEAVFSSDDSTGLVFSDACLVDQHLRPLGYSASGAFGLSRRDRARIREGDAFSVMARGDAVPGCTVAFRSSYRDLILPITTTGWLHDAWIAMMVSVLAGVQFVPRRLVLYRVHGRQETAPLAALGRKHVQRATRPLDRELLRQAIAALADARSHLAGGPSHRTMVQGMARIEERLDFLTMRAGLPARRYERLRVIAHALLAGQYLGQYRGGRALVRDLACRG
jgi:Glycosyl transferase family 2